MPADCSAPYVLFGAIALLLAILVSVPSLAQKSAAHSPAYLGFDRNDYPGDQYLATLRKTFTYSGYWLNNPPGASTNTWLGKRQALESAGFGFLVLFNGRLYAQIKSGGDPQSRGKSDAHTAVAAAQKEGFPAHTIIFLDQEEGGRLLPEQRAYLLAWVDAVNASEFGAGIYCPGIPFREGNGTLVNTADNIRENSGTRTIAFWVVNDACPPSPGCTFPAHSLTPAMSGISYADVWQYAQSPKRKDVAKACASYDSDGSCYAPGFDRASRIHIDVNTANSADPSHGRTSR
jgi:Rv2525c-like, glycoside hydrolase-like domain